MSPCDATRQDLGAYVLAALEPGEAEAVRAHLARCRDCAREHARLAELPALLTLAERAETAGDPAPAVEERVLDAVARERGPARERGRLRRPQPAGDGRRRLRRMWPAPRRSSGRRVAAAGGLAAVAVAVALALVLGGGSGAGYPVELRSVAGASAAGRAELQSADNGTTMRLWVRNLPPDPGVVYEVRCDGAGWSASAGTFRADDDGRAYVELTTAARRGEYDAIRVVRGGSDVLTATLN